MQPKKYILPKIVLAQFLCTSLWFAGNGVMDDLMVNFELHTSAVGSLTSLVQFGFISGTLLFAVVSLVDRYSPSKVFFVCALLGGIFNIGLIWEGNSYLTILIFRFFTGFFLAGIYPVGMKIAADYFEKGLGKSLGYLVGALVLGTAFPHLLKDLKGELPWELVLITTSSLATIGGILMLTLVPDGPHQKRMKKINLMAVHRIFKKREFRSAAIGYFGHMWELYAFWTFVPVMFQIFSSNHSETSFNTSILSFFVVGIGALACIMGGYLAEKHGPAQIAFIALLSSCLCCLITPFIFSLDSKTVFITFLLFWGMVIIADSPLFSTLVAQNAPVELKGTALTIVTCIGFSLTIISIQLINFLRSMTEGTYIFMILAIGPIIGLMAMRQSKF